MRFSPTKYHLVNVASGREFEDKGWTLSDPEGGKPSLVRAVYDKKKFTPRERLSGIYRYADWMPIRRTLRRSSAPVTYKSEALAAHLGLENLYITFSGWNPAIGAEMRTCSFKETEAYSVLARLAPDEKRTLIVQSAGNTALSTICGSTAGSTAASSCWRSRMAVTITMPSPWARSWPRIPVSCWKAAPRMWRGGTAWARRC